MEILRHGTTYQKIYCDNCNTEIGFSYRDIEHKIIRDVYNGTTHDTTTEFIYCPECGSRLVLTLMIDGQERPIQKQ